MELGIKNKCALVMASSAGIGKGIAASLVEEEARVVVCARNEERLHKTAKEIGATLAIPWDLSKEGNGRRLVEKVHQEMGGLDILVINCGGPPKGGFQELEDEQWVRSFQEVWMVAVESIQAALPSMIEKHWGRIVLVTSIAAKEAMGNLTISNGLRAGLHGLMRSISNEIAKHGVTINALLPGYTKTERLQELGIPEETMTAEIPAGRLGEPKEMGSLAAFLASDAAAYITGQTIACDGGYLRGI